MLEAVVGDKGRIDETVDMQVKDVIDVYVGQAKRGAVSKKQLIKNI